MFFIYLFLLIYLFFMIWLFDGYNYLVKKIDYNNKDLPFISIVVAIKNEEDNLSTLINNLINQDYPKKLYEIIICNDRSNDNSLDIIQSFKHRHQNFHIINIKSLPNNWVGKKWALFNGIKKSKGEIILQTDADCTMSKKWISSMISQFSDKSVGFVSSLTPLFANNNFFDKILSIDSIAQDAFVACSFGKKMTLSCVARSIAFRKKYFFQSGGYNQISHIESGDDDLLLHKIMHYVGCDVKYIINQDAVVYSLPPNNLIQFIHQRLRFASKGFLYYKNKFISNELKIILPVLYLVNLFTVICIVNFCQTASLVYLVPIFLKLIPDFLFIYTFGYDLKIKFDIFPVLFLVLMHPFYIVFFGILGPIYSYKWK